MIEQVLYIYSKTLITRDNCVESEISELKENNSHMRKIIHYIKESK